MCGHCCPFGVQRGVLPCEALVSTDVSELGSLDRLIRPAVRWGRAETGQSYRGWEHTGRVEEGRWKDGHFPASWPPGEWRQTAVC